MFIEFFSPPGAGKTTVSKQLAILLAAQGYEIMDRDTLRYYTTQWYQRNRGLNRVFDYLRFLASHVDLTRRTLDYIEQLKPRELDVIRRGVRFLRSYHDRTLLHEPPPLVLLDQGILQSLLSVTRFASSRDASKLQGLLETMESNLPHLVIYIDVPSDLLLERIQQRRSLIGSIGEIDAMAGLNASMLQTLIDSVEQITEAVQRANPACIIYRIDGTKPSEELVDELLGVILEMLESIHFPRSAVYGNHHE